MFRKFALAGAMALVVTLAALAANAPTYKDSAGQNRDAQGVVCINKDTGEPESCAGAGSGGAITSPVGAGTSAIAVRTTQGSDSPLVTQTGAVTETAPATDTASSGLNGRLQRIAQRITTLLTTQLDTNLKQVNGATTLTGNGTASGALRVALPTDGTGVVGLIAGSAVIGKTGIDQTTPGTTNLVAAGQNGTWTVQPGNTANTTPWLVTLQPTTSGGSSTFSANVTTAGSGAGTGGVAADASPGQLYGYAVYNGNSSVCYFGFYDQTQALTNLGTTTPKMSIGIPANGGANVAFPNGIPFATAITISATTTRAGSTACSTGLDINVMYK